MKGFNLSTGITLTSFGGWKTDKEKSNSDKGFRGFFNKLKKKRSKEKKESSANSTSSPSIVE
jgi:hypothetical protein